MKIQQRIVATVLGAMAGLATGCAAVPVTPEKAAAAQSASLSCTLSQRNLIPYRMMQSRLSFEADVNLRVSNKVSPAPEAEFAFRGEPIGLAGAISWEHAYEADPKSCVYIDARPTAGTKVDAFNFSYREDGGLLAITDKRIGVVPQVAGKLTKFVTTIASTALGVAARGGGVQIFGEDDTKEEVHHIAASLTIDELPIKSAPISRIANDELTKFSPGSRMLVNAYGIVAVRHDDESKNCTPVPTATQGIYYRLPRAIPITLYQLHKKGDGPHTLTYLEQKILNVVDQCSEIARMDIDKTAWADRSVTIAFSPSGVPQQIGITADSALQGIAIAADAAATGFSDGVIQGNNIANSIGKIAIDRITRETDLLEAEKNNILERIERDGVEMTAPERLQIQILTQRIELLGKEKDQVEAELNLQFAGELRSLELTQQLMSAQFGLEESSLSNEKSLLTLRAELEELKRELAEDKAKQSQ